MIKQAVKAELQIMLSQDSHHQFNGRHVVICNGYLPERTIQTELGDVEVNLKFRSLISEFLL